MGSPAENKKILFRLPLRKNSANQADFLNLISVLLKKMSRKSDEILPGLVGNTKPHTINASGTADKVYSKAEA